MQAAVAEIVRQQVESGVDVVSDGEQGKIGYSTYVKDRLTGFEGEATVNVRADWADFPTATVPLAARVKRPSCNGPVAWKDPDAVQGDIAAFRTALEQSTAEEAFLTAASPGVIAHFLGNQYYPTREEYLATLADVMKQEFEAIVEAGFLLQLDCPDLAMSRHMRFSDLDIAEFLKIAEGNVEALNHAISGIPADRVRLHLCWGNYEGPHHRDVPLRDIMPVVLKANVGAISMEGANPTPRPRVGRLQGRSPAGRHGPHPRRHRLHHQLHRAPGAGGAANRRLRGCGRQGAGHRGFGLRLRHLRQHSAQRAAGNCLGQAGVPR